MAGTGPRLPIVGGVAEPQPAPPKEYRFSEQAIGELNEIMSHYPEKKAAMLPALWIAQREYGGVLTPQALQEVADRLGRSYAEVEGVATFYSMYNFQRRGRHHLEVCTCLTCGATNAYAVVHKLEERLGIRLGEVTPDGEFSLAEVECLDWCEAATVVQVGDRYYGNVSPDNVDALLEELKRDEDRTPQAQADTIVRMHLRGRSATPDEPDKHGGTE
ncbi:MAG: NAD(P)H-dependent oxidoreductase subunit E [Chthonomonadales bacterium]